MGTPSKEKFNMPIVSVKIAKGRPQGVKRKLVESITDAVATSLELKPELVTVLIEEFERENWAAETIGPAYCQHWRIGGD